MLATTSVGQEGLDFHLYSRKVAHWNLPSNHIDLEQREGRINRYMCYAIRQNIAVNEDVPDWNDKFEQNKLVGNENISFFPVNTLLKSPSRQKGPLMNDFNTIKSLVGEIVTEADLRYVDCYVHKKMGLFIPSVGACQYAIRPSHTHPSYMVIISFLSDSFHVKPTIELKENHYLATVLSPGIPHTDDEELWSHYYCIMIDKEYFDEQFKMYSKEKPDFRWKEFAICHDILKTLNTFAFEYSKRMQNSDITLDAQATIVTHWIIRSILGENYDMRAISSNYAVARAEHYIEQHFSEMITVKRLAELGNMSVSSFNRIFKKETKLTPIEYLIEIRLQKSKKLLRRKEIPITEIAMRCGFGSSSHFSTCFSRLFNVTPSEYRNSYN